MKDDDSTWPEMSATEWDDDGFASVGTYPTSTIRVGGYRAHNEPVPMVDSAACAFCNRWAVEFYIGAHQVVDGPLMNSIHRRMGMTLIYVCDRHKDDACNELLDTYASCSNSLSDLIELALKVEASRASRANADFKRAERKKAGEQ